jgi:hypothetical protein
VKLRRLKPVVLAAVAIVTVGMFGCRKTAPPQQHAKAAPAAPPPSSAAGSSTAIPFPSGSLPQYSDPNAEPAKASTPPADIFDIAANPGATVLTPVDIHKLSQTEQEYGIAPRRTKDVEYADGVIVMEQGDKAIRSMGGDGMSWTFDANAPHVNEFQVGKIVFATGRAVGRIVGLKRDGDNVTAYLAPIQLTDVIKRGHFVMNQPVDLNNMLAYVAPNFPQPPDKWTGFKKAGFYPGDDSHFEEAVVVSRIHHGKWTPVSMAQTYPDGRRITYRKLGAGWSQGFVSLANVSPIALADPAERLRLSFPPAGEPEVPAFPPLPSAGQAGVPGLNIPLNLDGDDVRTKAEASNSGIGLQFYYHKNGVNLFAECLLQILDARVAFELNITDRGIETAGVQVNGQLGIKLLADAASEQNFSSNLHKVAYEPIEFSLPLGLNGALGVPFSLTFGSTLEIDTGFSAKTSKLSAEGLYTFGGGLWAGMKNGHWSVSTASNPQAEQDIGKTLSGISVGINAMVVASSIRAMVGIGAFGFNTGVFVQIIFSGTLLRAPDIAFPCRQGTIVAFMAYGIGYSLPKAVVAIVNAILSAFTSYRIQEQGTIAKSKPTELFHGKTQIPGGCSASSPPGGS